MSILTDRHSGDTLLLRCDTELEDINMIKRMTKHGNSLALVIERPILELLEIDSETPLSITTDGKCLIVSPVRDPEMRKKFKEALEEGNRKYSKMFKRLAE